MDSDNRRESAKAYVVYILMTGLETLLKNTDGRLQAP
jgi:hypothetical protein